MKRLLFVTEFAGFSGGIERYAFDLAQLLRSAGDRVELLAGRAGREPEAFAAGFDAVHLQIPDGLENFDACILHKCRPVDIWDRLLQQFGSRLIAVAHDHDLYCPRKYLYTPFGRVNCHRAYSGLRCSLCGLARRHPEGIPAALRETLRDFPQRLRRLRECGAVVALSEFMRENLERNGVPPEKIRLIHPAAETARPTTGSGNPGVPRIGFAGQLIRGKGADTFLRILPRLQSPFTAVLAGDGNERDVLEKQAATEFPAAEFVGFLPDLDAFYRSCDLLVLPFRWQEPFGLVGIEAAARGIPVVAFRIGGVPEWLRDGVTGLAVPPGDEDALAEAVHALLGNPARRAAMGREATSWAQTEFSREKLLKNWQSLLTENT